MKQSQIWGLAALVILIVMNFIPATDLLSRSAINTIGILLAIIVLLISEPIPIGVTCLLVIPLLVIFKATPNISAALTGYINPIVFFVLASFGISRAITKVPLANRLLRALIILFGKNIKLILLAFMVAAATVSSVISNVATTAVFIPAVIAFLSIYGNRADKNKTAKAFMIGLPVASMLGGMLTPAGSALNLMTLSFLNQLTGINITFVQWMFIGMPIVVVVLPLAWLIMIKVYGVIEFTRDEMKLFVKNLDIPEKMDFKEKYVIILMALMFIFWLLSSWYPVFNITVIILVGFALLFVPKYEILSWDEFISSVSWPAFFLIGSILSIGHALITNGVSEWLVASYFPSAINLPYAGIAFAVAIIVFLMLIIIPVAPALIPLLAAPFVGIAQNTGFSPVLPIMTLGLMVANCFLLPLDTVPLLTYMTGHYKMLEMPKSTALIQLILAAAAALWIPVALILLDFL